MVGLLLITDKSQCENCYSVITSKNIMLDRSQKYNNVLLLVSQQVEFILKLKSKICV